MSTPEHLTDAALEYQRDHDALPHYRQIAADLLQVPGDVRCDVSLAAMRLVNTAGWRYSSAISQRVREYLADPEAYRLRRELDHEHDQMVQRRERQLIANGVIDLDRIGL